MPAIIELIKAYDQKVVKPKSFFKDNFFKVRKTKARKKFEVQFRKGRMLAAPFVSELIPGTEIPKRTFKSEFYQAPKIAPKETFTVDQLYLDQHFGETIYGGKSSKQKRNELIGESLAEFEEMIIRKEELMCIRTLYEGEVIVEGEGVKDKITYGTVKRAQVGVKWTEANADIIGDIRGAITDIGKKTGARPEMLVVDPDTAALIENNEKIKDKLDTRNFNLGNISPKELPDGAIFIGTLAPFHLPIISYQGQYEVMKANGELEMRDIVPQGTMLLAPSNNEILYGSAGDIKKGIIQAERAVFQDEDTKSNTLEIRTETRPLPVVYDIEAIRILEVI